jgi:hypothetical protein
MAAFAAATPATTAKADSQTQNQTEEKRKTLMAEATSALQETQAALKYLDGGKTKDALAALERATGKLNIILARDPKLELAPAGVNVVTYDFQGGLDAVKRARKRAQDLMDEGRLQEARALLKYLASETVISVSNIPLGTYPDAIKNAVKLIDENKMSDAKRVLQAALNTQVVTESVVPLPVMRAQESLKAAEPLAEKKDRTKEDNERLKASMDQALSQLELAQEFGYGTKGDFDKLYGQLRTLEEKTADNKFGTGWFANIKDSIGDLMKSSQPSKR